MKELTMTNMFGVVSKNSMKAS
eukprot:COSAG01_NODE_66893_length_268_cov_1.532544_1_plen_21_part_10